MLDNLGFHFFVLFFFVLLVQNTIFVFIERHTAKNGVTTKAVFGVTRVIDIPCTGTANRTRRVANTFHFIIEFVKCHFGHVHTIFYMPCILAVI